MFELFFALLILLNIADIVTTHVACKSPMVKELNPMINWLSTKIGLIPSLLVNKAPLLGLLLFLYYSCGHIGYLTSIFLTSGIIVAYILVVVNNLVVIHKLHT
jgi:hypothetical protein